MANKYQGNNSNPESYDGASGGIKDISKKGEVYTKPTKVETSAKFTPYRDVGGNANKEYQEHANW